MKSLSRLFVSLLALLGAAALPAAAQTVLNVNTALTTDGIDVRRIERMKANVEKRSAGKLTIRLAFGSQLARTRTPRAGARQITSPCWSTAVSARAVRHELASWARRTSSTT
jgi:TRAP-type C4-dicarboxylate transport system substrate-binding protein